MFEPVRALSTLYLPLVLSLVELCVLGIVSKNPSENKAFGRLGPMLMQCRRRKKEGYVCVN